MTKEFLEDMYSLLHGDYYEKKFRIKGKQSMWIPQKTRINMYRCLEYMHQNDVARKKRWYYNEEKIYKALKLDPRNCARALLLLCVIEKNPIRITAWQTFNKRVNGVPKKALIFRIIAPLEL